jgi:DNA modification methylase
MAITNKITDRFAVYNGDCIEVTKQLPDNSIHFSVYSPPFCGLYNYSSDEKDMSNCRNAEEFFKHYEFLIKEKHRITMPGRLSAVHCCDIPAKGGALRDLPGDIIRLHEANGWKYHARYAIWKEPLRVAIRTRSKGLTHRQIVKDSTHSNNAGADYMVVFKKEGENPSPVVHPRGMLDYAGEREVPLGLKEKFAGWEDPQTNKLAHWIWQQYASAFWDDIRIGRVLSYKHAKEKDEEKHCHPLQLDVIERCVTLWTNPGEKVFTPFMGVGSEVFGAVSMGRLGIGVELKPSYFRQALENLKSAHLPKTDQGGLFADAAPDEDAIEPTDETP